MVENLGRWLRAVRPKTEADMDWSATEEADRVLAKIHEAVGIDPVAADGAAGAPLPPGRWRTLVRGHQRRRRWALPRVWIGVGAVAAAVIAVAVVVSVSATTPNHPSAHKAAPAELPASSMRPAAMLLDNYSSCEALLSGLRSHAAASVSAYGFLGQMMTPYAVNHAVGTASVPGAPVAAGANSAPDASPALGTTDTSTTNVQEPGVDEPDIVKTGGNHVVSITNGTLHVVDGSSRTVTGSLDLTMYAGWQGAQLLVDGDHALVLLSSASGPVTYGGGPMLMPNRYGASGPSSMLSTYLFVSLAGQPTVTGSMRATGAYLDARMIGSTVRLIVDSAPVINFPSPNFPSTGAKPSKEANQKVVEQAPLSAWQPQYTLTNGASSSKHTVPCQQISHPAEYSGSSMLTIYTLDMNRLGEDTNPVSVAADGDSAYATAQSLYIASNPSSYCCDGPAVAPKPQQTEIHRFNIAGAARPTYLGSASVPGRLLSQFSLSDFGGHLRIATTSGELGSAPQSSSVYVLDSATLKTTGHVDGLGTGEQIYAVRFMGPVAYVVTFKQTDPLYVVDLADPAAPKVVGTLKLTGYSDYLHDAGNGRLLGVGQQASAQGTVAGLQVSLFDVTNPATPVRTGQIVRSDAVGESSLDPHAFLYWPPTGLVVVPVQSWVPTQSGKVLVLQVTGDKLTSLGLLANPLNVGAPDDGLGIQRSLVVDGALWTLSGSGLQVSDPSTLKRQAWIAFS